MAENAVIYARYSSHSQTEQSIEGQLAAAHGYAAAKGYTIVHEYIDRAQSGRTDDRDAFQRMLSDCAKKAFTVIITWKVDRFGRNREEITFNKYRAKKHGVRVEYVAENVPDSPEGVILESILEGMAEYYSLQLAQNIRRGQKEGAKKHHVFGGLPPLGYKTAADKTYEIDPITAPVIKDIFDKYCGGWTMAEISRWLNLHGFRTRSGGLFGKDSLRRILSNKRYAGTYAFKGTEEPDVIPAIVTMEQYEAAQKMLVRNKRTPKKGIEYTDFILTGKIFCGLCGSRMAGTSGKSATGAKYTYYTCSEAKAHACGLKPIRRDVIEAWVLDTVVRVLHDDEVMNLIVKTTWDLYLKERADNSAAEALHAQLADVDGQIGALVDALASGVKSSAITDRLKQLEEQKTALEGTLAAAELKEESTALTEDHIRYFLLKLRDLDIKDRPSQLRLVETFVRAVYVYNDQVLIELNTTGDDNGARISRSELETPTRSGALQTLAAEFRAFGSCVHNSTGARTVELLTTNRAILVRILRDANEKA